MIGIISELSANFIQTFIVTLFVSRFCEYKYNGIRRYIGFCFAWFLDFVAISIINYYTDYDGLISIIIVLLLMAYATIFLKGNILEHIFISLSTVTIVFTVASVLFLTSSVISGIAAGFLFSSFSGMRFILLILCRVFEVVCFVLILRIRKQYNLNDKEWITFVIMTTMTWFEVMLFTRASMKSDQIAIYMTGASLIAVFINIITYYFITKVQIDSSFITEKALVDMQHDNAISTENNVKTLYNNLHSLKHDLEKHFVAIKAMIEHNQKTEAASYIDRISKTSLKSIQKVIFTDNNVFNAIMNVRFTTCHERGIETVININSAALDKIQPEDTAVLFGNIFDNAIEAAENTKEKIITLSIGFENKYISICMENSYNPDLNSNKQKDKQECGYGLNNVRNVVKKYDGMIDIYEDNNMFCCDILLSINDDDK